MDGDTITAICALVVSILAVSFSIWSDWRQRRHERLSVKPVGVILREDYSAKLRILIGNRGLGPMLITKLEVTKDDGSQYDDLISAMPDLTKHSGVPILSWKDYYTGDIIMESVLKQGENMVLIWLEGNTGDTVYETFRESVRAELCKITGKLSYKDMYGDTEESKTQSLSYFRRSQT